MAISGKLEVTLKISELPVAQTLENGWQEFEIDCDRLVVSVTVKPKVWKKLTDAQANYPLWIAAISGKMGDLTDKGFALLEPNIQTFEKKPKEPKAEATPATA
ncbi:fertility inhibition FinO-like protein [Brunnivagina elsteri]|uniref:Fertility inhibition FinO-like protein n=1 Tax=Brunnivagina elsteri CCALA 953 TaxID=987040 RepID=A0A2A2TNZ5_9CYAN|nr:fertility inhibition FinO-like protein [Calothrix elsteri]PAX60231.1 fertility inhibition FinO-like protein [Calothrix elsteri CCALA 953]